MNSKRFELNLVESALLNTLVCDFKGRDDGLWRNEVRHCIGCCSVHFTNALQLAKLSRGEECGYTELEVGL